MGVLRVWVPVDGDHLARKIGVASKDEKVVVRTIYKWSLEGGNWWQPTKCLDSGKPTHMKGGTTKISIVGAGTTGSMVGIQNSPCSDYGLRVEEQELPAQWAIQVGGI